VKTRLLGINHVGVVIVVQLVMKSINTFLTPGKLVIAVPLDPNWMCDCPGVEQFKVGDSYLITGTVEPKKSNRSGYILQVDHKSLVIPWNEGLLDDMVENHKKYNKLKLRPSYTLYKILFTS